jgi:hypothetical protein
VELHDPGYAKRFYSIYEIFEDSMTKVIEDVLLFLAEIVLLVSSFL